MKNIFVAFFLLIIAQAHGQADIAVADKNDIKADTIVTTARIEGLSFIKVRSADKETMFLSITLHSTLGIEGQSGANLFLEGGKTINKNDAKIKVQPIQGDNHYLYSSLIELDEKDISLLTSYPVSRFKLYIYYNELKDGKRLMEEFQNLLEQ